MNIGSVFELSGLAFCPVPPYGGLLVYRSDKEILPMNPEIWKHSKTWNRAAKMECRHHRWAWRLHFNVAWLTLQCWMPNKSIYNQPGIRKWSPQWRPNLGSESQIWWFAESCKIVHIITSQSANVLYVLYWQLFHIYNCFAETWKRNSQTPRLRVRENMLGQE